MKSQVVMGGCTERTRQQILETTGFTEGSLPFRYLRVPITASKLHKLECTMLVEKIATKIKYWATRTLSYAGRATLVNTMLLGVFNFWASIFILPQEITKNITRMCTYYIWGTSDSKRRPALVAWQYMCIPKKNRGLGLENLQTWNKACIAKLVWAVKRKKDLLLVRWIHGRYLKNTS